MAPPCKRHGNAIGWIMIAGMRLNPGLRGASRLHGLTHDSDSVTIVELLTLVGTGVLAAALSTLVDLHLRVPGHAILKVVFPISAGFALVPRRGAGTVLCASALATSLCLRGLGPGGFGAGFGALTSLAVIGPLLDWTLRHAKPGRSIYLRVMTAGLLANLAALTVKASLKGFGLEPVGGRPLSVWLGQAIVTYTVCGLVAGLLSALVWFVSRSTHASTDENAPQ